MTATRRQFQGKLKRMQEDSPLLIRSMGQTENSFGKLSQEILLGGVKGKSILKKNQIH
jgi:hypothetical protein